MTTPLTVVVQSDGGSRGNPGPAGYGAVVLDAPDGSVLAERCGYLGVVTNNVAEYCGLLAGLRAAADLGARRVDIRLDSKLIVEQMTGHWKVKHPDIRPLARAAAGLVAGFDAVTFGWVPRARNTAADRLANRAMDEGQGGRATAETVGAQAASVASGSTSPSGAAPSLTAPTPAPARTAAPVAPAGAEPQPSLFDPEARGSGGDTRFVIVRHGETETGATNRYAGRSDVALTDRGRAQAASVAQRVVRTHPAVVLSSPLSRCRITAAAVAEATGARVEILDDLVDGDLGEWTGLTGQEAAAGWPELFAGWGTHPDIPPPGGESDADIAVRAARVIEFVLRRYRGRTVVIVTHAVIGKLLLARALDVPSPVAFKFRLDTASLSGFSIAADGAATVWAVNEVGHLPD